MSSKGYAPKLFATFDNGMVYSYIPGEVLNVNTCRDPTVYPLVATMLAKMHKLSYDASIPKVPLVWDKCKCFIDLIPEQYSSSEKQLRWSTATAISADYENEIFYIMLEQPKK